MRALLFIFIFSLIHTISYSQASVSINDTRNVFDEKGDYYFDINDFKKAIIYYNMAFKKDANNYYSVLKKAEAYTALDLNEQAAESYRIIFETDLFIPNDYRLKFANLLLKNKDIKGFEEWMAKYNEIVNTEISGFISSSDTRAKMYKDSSIVIVENESFLNTSESEICPSVYRNQLVFASTRKNLSGTRSNSEYNLFSASYMNDGQLGRLNKFNKSINSNLNEIAIAFIDKENKIYFTRTSSGNSNLKTYIASIPSSVDEKIDVQEFLITGISSIGHPTFNKAGTKLFFVSDAPGGSGGLDIYSSELIGGKWSTPKNLGSTINSNKDEMYPHLVNDQTLYFTSAGHNGLGGLDLFSVNLKDENSAPKNLGNKVNSKYDEYSLSFSSEGLTGYFCSNRPGGFGKEDIYRLQLLDLKVKYAAYKFKQKTKMEAGKINLYISSGEEYNIASEGNTGFNFSFQPEENYKIVIQQENVLANNVINNSNLSPVQRKKEFLSPAPIKKTDISLQAGMKYQFTAGMKSLSNEYKTSLNDMAGEYQGSASSSIDLTALAKELMLKDGEVYTIRFVKDDSHPSNYKAKGESNLYISQQTISVAGKSFFFVLPLDVEVNFNVKTDIAHFKENYNPKKVGAVKVDAAPVFKEEVIKESAGFPILVNTENSKEAAKKISATEFTVIPGTEYILTLSKPSTGKVEALEIVVPLTKGVKYNLGTEAQSKSEYNKALNALGAGQAGKTNTDEELIDISILSKELNISSEDNIVFNLMPATKIASQATAARSVLTTLDIDGRKIFVTDKVKLQVNLKLDQSKKVNIQTDLAYVKENFVPSTIALKLDTSSFTKDLILDPVFDVIVVNFALNEYGIRPDAKTILNEKVIKALKGDKRLYVTIKGYTDGLGNAEHNAKLSSDRAYAVKNYLSTNGIGESRIRTFSFGESMSLKGGVKWEDLSEDELQKHRKVEIVIYLPE